MHSIFVRDISGPFPSSPHMLAYDIGSKSEAESIIAGIANSYREHGQLPNRAARWFCHRGRTYEIYPWLHRG